MTDYLRLAQERAPQSVEQEDNPYLPLARQQQELQQNRARTVIETALKDNPDVAAERLRLSQTSGLPPDVVRRNLEELRVKEQARAIDLVKMAQESPVLYRQITDATFATTSIDDLDTLKNLERSVVKGLNYLDPRNKNSLSADVAGLTVDVGLAATAGVGEMLFNVAGTLNDLIGWQSGAEGARAQANRSREARQSFGFQPESSTGQAVKSGVQSAGTNLALLPLGLARATYSTSAQAGSVVAGAMAAGVGADAYLSGREQGLTQGEALRFAIPQAGYEYLFEKIPASKLFGDIAANTGLLKTLGKQAVSEGWTEQVTTLAQDFNEWMNLNPDKTLGQFIQERPEAAYQTFIATLVGVGVQTTTIKGINKIIERSSNEALVFEQDLLQQQMQLASQSALRARSPEQFRTHVQRVVDSDDGTKKEIYVDAEVLNQMPQELLAQLPESVREALPDALETRSTVAIPMADVLTVAPGTELEQILNDNARMRPNAASRVEAQMAAEFLAQDAQRVLEQAQDQTAWQQSAAAVQQTILDQLNATGRFTSDVNEAYALLQGNFFSSMAARLGITPQDLYDRYSLKVSAKQPGGAVLNDGALGQGGVFDLSVPEDGNQLRDVKVGDTTISLNARGRFSNPEGVVEVASVRTPQAKRGSGSARAALQALVQQADAQGVTLKLDASPLDRKTKGDKLVKFYESLGFQRTGKSNNAAGDPEMVREPQQVLEQRGVQVKGKEIASTVDQVSNVEASFEFAGSQQFPNNRDFKLAIQARVIEAAKAAKVKLDEFTQGVERYLTRMAVADGITALRTNANAVGWYNEKVTKALRLVSLIHPEIATDPQAKFAFVWAMAVTSNGLKVDKNFELAEKVYQGYKTTGQMPTDIGIGTAAEAINRSLGLYNTLIAKHGFDAVERFMTTMQSAGEVEKFTGQKVTGENKTTMVYGAAALGPKIGNGFFMNLYGRFEQLTMDRWLMRTWGRWTGTLVESNPAQVKAKRTSLKALIQSLTPADKKAFEAIIKRKLTVGDIDAVGQAIWKASQKPANRVAMAKIGAVDEAGQAKLTEILGEPKKDQVRVSIGDELRKGGNALTKYLDGQKEAPAGPPERGNIRKVFSSALAELQKQHPALTMSDFQALLWYPEKRLYDAAKTSEEAADAYEDDEAPDYANAAAKLARAQGIPDSDIDAAIAAVDAELQAAVSSGGARPGERGTGPADGTLSQGGINVRPEQTGDGAGRAVDAGSTPLPGAPVIEGATGPDARLVAVAEQYAKDNGIDLRRQGEYVQVDPDRAARIAAAYDAMEHAPNDPAVREAYENLIRQTVAQYRALEAAGYKFWFIEPTNDPYKSPWDAMRDMRANQSMGVFPTVAGFGSGATDVDISDNPLMADTGIRWPYGSANGELKPVLANDLFRAVHDAFGHGLEGAGFRAQGEENAWQAHIRLFTGSAKGAITSETRGQNSWLNFGPYGESNRTAKVEDTVFADQKTGLMPEWTWNEGIAPDMQPPSANVLNQDARGTFSPEQLLVTLNENADLSTFLHESGHFFLEVMADLASQPNAPQQIQDDMAATLAWFGVPDLATWNGYTLEQKREYHEKWAESFEQYLFEGKAPNPELQPLFRRFRSWLINVYKSLQQFMRGRDLQLGDDIRQVFDRMIATDEQIAQAEEAAGMLPDFDATNEAIEKLQARSLRDLKWTVNARNKYIKKLQAEAKDLRKGVEAEVRAEVEQQPIYKAMRWLKKGETTDPETGDLIKAEKGYRLSTQALAEMYPDTMLARPDLTRLKGMTSKEGLHPDVVADMFGFESGDALVRNLLDAEPIASVIEGMTDQRMLERHGDLVDARAIEEAANEAVHNEARARALATELRTQQEMMSQRQDTGRTDARGRPITVNSITQAAKEFALNLASRRRIKDLKNAAWQHRSAEARAGKAWQAATAKGETEAAVQAKRDQVLNNAAAAALQDAQAEVKKALEFFKRITKGNDEKTVERGRDPDVVNAMRAILAAYGVAPRLEKSALAYMETVAKNDPAMYAALNPAVNAAMLDAKPLKEMTVEELRGLTDTLRSMWNLAKRSRQMEVDGNLLDIEDAADELMARMDDIGIPDQVPGEKGAITDKEERGLKLQFAKSILRRVEQWAEGMDGKFGGPFLRLVFQPVKEAADRYRTARVDYRKRYTDMVKNLAPLMPPGAIDAPELGYKFGNARDSGTAELLHAILHTGNDSNKRKLLLGRGWASENADGTLDTSKWDAFIQRMISEGKLRKEHYDFAQGVWDLLEETKPLAQQAHRQVFGRYFAEVTANEFTTPFGTYRGGYVPAQTDSRLVKDAKLRELAEGENESMAYAFPAAPSGFTKARVDYNKPLLLDLRTLGQHIDKVLLFSHMQPAITDVRRLLTDKRVSYALDRIDPGAYEGMLIPWLNRSAKQIVETPVVGDRKLSRFLSAARSRAGMALMFANLSNTVQQITGFTLAAVKVKPTLMLKAMAQFTAGPKDFKKSVADASPYMKDRMLNDMSAMNDAVEEILVDPSLLERGQAWTQRHAYFLQSAADNVMSPVIWTAAYNQAIGEGQNAKDAVRFADGVVRQTQGSLLPEDVSRFETGPAYARLFTQFVSYFNMMANTNATAVKQITEEMGLRKGAGKVLYVALVGLLAPIWIAEAIAQAFRGGPEDDEGDGYLDDWLAAVFGFGTIKGLTAQVPIVGQGAQLVLSRFNDNPADDKFSLSPAVSLIESSVGAPSSVYKAVMEEGSAQKAVRDTAAAATLLTGLPIYAASRPIGYAAGMADDRIEPTGPVDLTRGLVTGTASPQSKQP